MNKTTLSKRHPYIQSLECRKFSRNKHCNTISCSTQLPPLIRQTPNKINQSLSLQKKTELPAYQFIPRKLPEAQDIINKIFRSKIKPDRQPRQNTLIDIKKQLIKIINEKKKEVCSFRNGEIKMKWQIQRQAKKLKQNQQKKQTQQQLKFKEQQRQRLLMVLKRRKVNQQKFLQVGKKGKRQTSINSSWGSQQFLKTQIQQLKSKLRSECINAMKQKDSFYSSMGRAVTANPEDY